MPGTQVGIGQCQCRNRLPTVRTLNLWTEYGVLQTRIDHQGFKVSSFGNGASTCLIIEYARIHSSVFAAIVTDSYSEFSSTPSYWSAVDLSQAAFVAPNAVVIGDVAIASGVSIWYGAVVRGDVERIEIGECTNIQDGSLSGK